MRSVWCNIFGCDEFFYFIDFVHFNPILAIEGLFSILVFTIEKRSIL